VRAAGLFADGTYGAGWNAVGATDYLGVAGKGVTGLFYGDKTQVVAQLFEIGACITWNVIVGGVIFYVLGKVVPMRVTAAVEIAGLDVPEMGVPAYPEWHSPVAPEDVPQEQVAAAMSSLAPAKAG
jgi:Amt family ammonium transporter